MGDNEHDNKGSLVCRQCGVEIKQGYCWYCYGSLTAQMIHRWNKTSDLDQIHRWLERLDAHMEELEEMLRYIRTKLIPSKLKDTEWRI